MSQLFKYSRTYHFPWSPGTTSDDRLLKNTDHFVGKEVVVTEKLDGENTSMYPDHIHARSLDSLHHASRALVKGLHGRIAHEIPKGWRLCGENVTAYHSIHYHALPSCFFLFAIYDENNYCLSWDDTQFYAGLLGIPTVPVLYRGPWDEAKVKACWTGKSYFQPTPKPDFIECLVECGVEPNRRTICNRHPGDGSFDRQEGYVCRVAERFHYEVQDEGEDFSKVIAKYVRKGHVQSSESWLTEYNANPVNNWFVNEKV